MKHLQQFSTFNESKKESKPDLLEEIKSDLKRFNPGGDPEDPTISGNTVSKDIRHLGNWIHDEESHYEEEDDSWMEDDDQMVWAPGEYKKYKAKFEDWCKSKPWYKHVDKLDLDGSEKNWVCFSVKLK